MINNSEFKKTNKSLHVFDIFILKLCGFFFFNISLKSFFTSAKAFEAKDIRHTYILTKTLFIEGLQFLNQYSKHLFKS